MIAEALVKGTPLLFCALSFLLAWKAGIVNVGAEGQFLAGALAATAVAARPSGPGLPLAAAALAAGALAGAAWAGIASWLVRRRGVLDVLATILLNFVAAGLVSVAVHGVLQESTRTFPQSNAVPESARLPALAAGTRLHAGVALAALLALAMALFLRRTKSGFRLIAAGAGPRAAEYAGIDVPRVRSAAFAAAGAAAGLGGAVELLGVTGRLFDAFSPGYGYLGLAVAVVGQLTPAGAAAAAALFGVVDVLSSLLQRRAGISAESALVFEGLLVLAALAVPRIRRRARRAEARA